MHGEFKAVNPEKITFDLRLRATLEDWCAIKSALYSGRDHAFGPETVLIEIINTVVEQAATTYGVTVDPVKDDPRD